MGLEFLVPALFGAKATAIVAFGLHQLNAVKR